MEYYVLEIVFIIVIFCLAIFVPVQFAMFVAGKTIDFKHRFLIDIPLLCVVLFHIFISVSFIKYVIDNAKMRNYKKDYESFLKSQNFISKSARDTKLIGDNVIEYYIGEERMVVDLTDKLSFLEN